MSRAERRAYERMNKNNDPRALPTNPAQKARAERMAQRRAAAKAASPARTSRMYWIRAAIVAMIAGLLAFSMQWPRMPMSLYVGLGVTAFILVAAFLLRAGLSRAGAAARERAASRR
jgi:protein-S-isoprenylcysteine O-methyltransferase Ste14